MTRETVKNLTLIMGIVALASALGMAQTAASQAPIQNLTGTLTCEGRITHMYTCQRNQTQQTCTLDCVQQGWKFALMVGDQAYLLAGDIHQLEPLAGGKATVTGVAMNGRIEVETASNAKHHIPGQSDSMPSSMGSDSSK